MWKKISLIKKKDMLQSIHGGGVIIVCPIQLLLDFEGTVCTAARSFVYLQPPVIRKHPVTGAV